MGERDECNRTEFGLKRDHRRIENRPGGAHPGAEQSAVCGSLMLGMVPGMLDRLSLSQSTDRNDTEYEEDREELESSTIHRQQPCIIQPNATGYPQDLSSCLLALERLLIIGVIL